MGNSQSVPKATFEEALHNSIESSLRSAAVVPSSVFSSLFFGLQQHESSTSITNGMWFSCGLEFDSFTVT